MTAVICTLLDINNILPAISIGLLLYLASDKILKQVFIEKVEKQSVVTKTGVGIYIFTWILLWILLYTFLYTPVYP